MGNASLLFSLSCSIPFPFLPFVHSAPLSSISSAVTPPFPHFPLGLFPSPYILPAAFLPSIASISSLNPAEGFGERVHAQALVSGRYEELF